MNNSQFGNVCDLIMNIINIIFLKIVLLYAHGWNYRDITDIVYNESFWSNNYYKLRF